MNFNNKFVAHTDLQKKELGYIELYTFIKNLLISKRNGVEYTNDLLQDFNVEKFRTMSVEELTKVFVELKTSYADRNTELTTLLEKLKYIQIINSNELEEAQAELAKIKKIRSNPAFQTGLEIISRRFLLGTATDEDKRKYAFDTELKRREDYLENIKIGSFQLAKNYNDEKNVEKVVNAHKKTFQKNFTRQVSLKTSDKEYLDQILTIVADEEINTLIKELKLENLRNMKDTKINLRMKMVEAIAKFAEIPKVQANLIMQDPNYKVKLLGTINMEDVRNKINTISMELNEHEVIDQFLRTERKKIAAEHLLKFKEGDDLYTRVITYGDMDNMEKVILKQHFGVSAEDYELWEATGEQKFDMPSAEEIDKIKLQYIVNDMRFLNLSKKKLQQQIKEDELKEEMMTGLIASYKTLLDKDILNKKEFDVIEKMIVEEFGKEKLKNINQLKANIKIHVARILLEKFLDNMENPLDKISVVIEKVFGSDENEIIVYEELFNHIINYGNNEPFTRLQQIFNDTLSFLSKIQKLNVNDEPTELMKNIKKIIIEGEESDFIDSGKWKNYYIGADGELKVENISFAGEGKLKHPVKAKTTAMYIHSFNLMMLIPYLPRDGKVMKVIRDELAKPMKVEEQTLEPIILEESPSKYPLNWVPQNKQGELVRRLINIEFKDMEPIYEDFVAATKEMLIELTSTGKLFKEADLKKLKVEFNALYDMFLNMYKMEIIPYDLNKLKSNKGFEDLKREYFLSIASSLFTRSLGKLLTVSNSKKVKTLLNGVLSLTGLYLNEKSDFLKVVKIAPKKVIGAQYEELLKKKEETKNDDLLNDFFDEDDTQNDIDFQLEEFEKAKTADELLENYMGIKTDSVGDNSDLYEFR